jgi:hypothetical protein
MQQNYEEKKIREFYTIKQQVRLILHENADCRNYDSLLICNWLNDCKDIQTIDQIRDLHQCISFESVRRARQLIQAKGDYLPTDETIIKRRRLQEIYEQVLSQM